MTLGLTASVPRSKWAPFLLRAPRIAKFNARASGPNLGSSGLRVYVFLYLSTILGGTKLILCNHTSSVRTVWFTTAIVGQFHPLAAFIACGLARPRLAWLSGIPGSSIYGKELSL